MNSPRTPLVLARSIATLIVLSASAVAADNVWTGNTSTDWNDPANWTLGHTPAGENAMINLNAPNPATINANIATTPVDIFVGRGAGATGLVNHRGGTASVGPGNWMYIGDNGGTGVYNLGDPTATGGSFSHLGLGNGSLNVKDGTNGRFYVGGYETFGSAGGTGTLNMNTTGTLAIGNDLAIGTDNATGIVNLDAGAITTGGWNFIGKRANADGGNGTLNISGGSLTNGGGRTYIGYGNSTGKIVMTGGTYNNIGDFVSVGHGNLTNATTPSIQMSGGTFNSSTMMIGGSGGNEQQPGKGTVTVNGAGALLNAAGEIWVGQLANSVGVLNVSAGTVTASNWIAVGRQNATGTMNLSGTGIVEKTGGTGSHIIIGSLSGNGTVNQTGGTMRTTGGGDIRMGEGTGGSGTWNLSGGTGSADAVRVGWAGGPANLNVSGTGALNTGELSVAENGDGTMTVSGGSVNVDHINAGSGTGKSIINQTAGTVVSAQWVATGFGSAQTTEYNISGGSTQAAGFEVGTATNAIVRVSGTGTLTATGGLEVGVRDNGNGDLRVSGGTVNAATLAIGGRGGQNTNVQGSVTQTGGLVKITGDADIKTPGSLAGAYTLSGGTLSVDGNFDNVDGSFTFSGGRLTRSNAGIIKVLGGLTPTGNAAILELDANKTFNIGGTFDITSGVTFDLTGLVIPGTAGPGIKTGTFTLGTDLAIAGLFDPVTDKVVGLTNTPNAVFISETAGEGGQFNPNTQSVFWVQENAGTVSLKYSVVPEPGTCGLLAFAGVALGMRRRRKA